MRRIRKWGPGLLLISPSLILLAVFVYGFLGWNFRVSLTNWDTLMGPYTDVGTRNYSGLLADERWWRDVQQLGIYTGVFVVGALAVGLLLAFLMDKGVRGESFFKSVFLFPMAVSFIASAIVWSWLMNNGKGDNTTGINKLLSYVGLDALQSNWHKSDSQFAIAAVALPAGWALSGYIMTLFLAGMRGVPDELREAARVDGARESQVYWHVVRPMLWPATMSAVVMLIHISMKTFDLLYAIDPDSPKVETPALYMYRKLGASLYAEGATIATILVVATAVVIIPYIWYTMRSERRS